MLGSLAFSSERVTDPGAEATLQRQRGLVLPNAVVPTNRLASVGKPLATREELSSKASFGMTSESPTRQTIAPSVVLAITYSFLERFGDGLVGPAHAKFLASSLLPLPFQ